MATSLDALEALLQFREGIPKKTGPQSERAAPAIPVPNPLDPTQPHLIEGDTPTPSFDRSFRVERNAKCIPAAKPNITPVSTSVPNPLASPPDKLPISVQRHATLPISSPIVLAAPSTPSKVLSHGFGLAHPMPMPAMSSDTNPGQVLSTEVRSDKIRDALNSKPQRGKKRENLNDLERLELTRTRNREHAKSTRMKKKARLEQLIETERKYLLLHEKEVLFTKRKETLVQLLERAGNPRSQNVVVQCPLSARLVEIASSDIIEPEFAASGSAALTDDDSGFVKVAVHGSDMESGNPKTLAGVIFTDFVPGTAEISAVSLFFSSPISAPSPVGMFPSVSVLSFNS